MPIIKNTTPVRDHTGAIATNRLLRFYRRDTGALLGSTTTSDGVSIGDSSFGSVVSLLHLDNNITDTSQNGLSFSQNNITFSFGQYKFGQSAVFNGSDSYIRGTNNMFQILSADFTVECWVYITANPSTIYGYVLAGCDTASGGWVLRIKNGGGAVEWVYPGLVGVQFTSSSGLPLDQWNHIAVSRVGSQHYGAINGEVTALSMGNRTTDATNVLSIGQSSFNGSTNGPFIGYIDDFRITTVGRYTSNFAVPDSAFYDINTPPPLNPGYFEFTTPYSGDIQVVGLADGVDTDRQDIIFRVRT